MPISHSTPKRQHCFCRRITFKATQRFLEPFCSSFLALSTPRRALTPLLLACSLRVILDIPLSIFLTMFGFPEDYLHSDELHKVIKVAEKKKATIRRAPSEINLGVATDDTVEAVACLLTSREAPHGRSSMLSL